MSNTVNEAEAPPTSTTETHRPRDVIDQLWDIWERELSELHYQGIDLHTRILDLFDARVVRVQSATERSIVASLEINMRYVTGGAPEVVGEPPHMPPKMRPGQDYIYNVWQRYTNLCAQGRRLFDLRITQQGRYRRLRTELDFMKQQMRELQQDLAHYESLLKEAKTQFNRGQLPPKLSDPPAGDDRPSDDPDGPSGDPPGDDPGPPGPPAAAEPLDERPSNGNRCPFICVHCLSLQLAVSQTQDKEATGPESGRDNSEWPIVHDVDPANTPLPRDPLARAESDAEYSEDLADTSNVRYPRLPPLPPRQTQPPQPPLPSPRGSASSTRSDGFNPKFPPLVPRPRSPRTKGTARCLELPGDDCPTDSICVNPKSIISIDSDDDDFSPRQTLPGHGSRPFPILSSGSSSASNHTINRPALQPTSTDDSDDSRTLVGTQSPPSIISISSSGSNTSSSDNSSSWEFEFIPTRPRLRPVFARDPKNVPKRSERSISIGSNASSSPPTSTEWRWRDGVWYPSPPSMLSTSPSESNPASSSSSSFDFNRPILVPSTTVNPASIQSQPQKPQNTTTSRQPTIPDPRPAQDIVPQPQTTTRRTYIGNPLLTPRLDVDLADFTFTDTTKRALLPAGNVSKHVQSNTGKEAPNPTNTNTAGGFLRGPQAGLGFKNVRSQNDNETEKGSGSGSDRPRGFLDNTSDSDTSLDRIISRGNGRHRQQGYGQSGGQGGGQKGGKRQQQKLRTKPVPFMHGGVQVNWSGIPNTGANARMNTGTNNWKNDNSQRNGKNRSQGKNYKGDGWSGNQQHGGGNGKDNGKRRGKPPSW